MTLPPLPLLFVAVASAAAPAVAQSTFPLLPDGTGNGIGTYIDRPGLATGGRYVAYATALISFSRNDVYVGDLETGIQTLVSVTHAGKRSIGHARFAGVSDDGLRAAFQSHSNDLVLGDVNGSTDIFLRDLAAGTTTLVPVDVPPDPDWDGYDSYAAYEPVISADGSTIAFTAAPLDLTYGYFGMAAVYAYDVATGTTTAVSISTGGALADDDSTLPCISADGRYVCFASAADNLLDGVPSSGGVFVRDRLLGTTTCVSVALDGTPQGGTSPQISPDGRFVAFSSSADDLVAFDHPVIWYGYNVFLHDRTTGSTELISSRIDGDPANSSNDFPALSGDARLVAFTSLSTELIEGDVTYRNRRQLFVRDRARGITRLISRDAKGDDASQDCLAPALSSDGTLLCFATISDNFLAPSTGHTIVGHSMRIDETASWHNFGSGWPGKHGVPSFTCGADPIVGTTLVAHVDSSSQAPYQVGFLLIGAQPAQIPTSLGGELLLLPIASIPFVLFTAGFDFIEELPYDESIAGGTLLAQVLQFDPAASEGVSFTPGLELHVGF